MFGTITRIFIALLVVTFTYQIQHTIAASSPCECTNATDQYCYISAAAVRHCYDGMKCDCSSRNLTTFPQLPTKKLIYLDLSNNNLTETTREAFAGLTELRFLDLTDNPIAEIGSKSFKNSSKMVELRLQTDSLKYNSLRGMTGLKKLDIYGNNKLSDIHIKVLKQLQNLEHLIITNSALRKLPESFLDGYQSLKVINLKDNKLDTIDEGAFNNTHNLLELHLANNEIKTVHHSVVKHADKLQVLDLSNNQLEHIDSDLLVNLPSVTRLDLSNNFLTLSNSSIFFNSLKSLTLDLSSNKIREFPKQLFTENTIESDSYIDFSRNELTKAELPRPVKGTVNLSWNQIRQIVVSDSIYNLYLSHNSISTPDDIKIASRAWIWNLDISHNSLTSLSKFYKISQHDVPRHVSKQTIDLSHNKIHDVDSDTFSSFYQLRKLSLNNNMISSIDNGLQLPSFIQHLNLANNSLNAFPKILNKFRQLRFLDLSNNNGIQELPGNAFGNFQNLQYLSLRETGLTVFPDSFLSNSSVKDKLDLSGNELSCSCRVILGVNRAEKTAKVIGTCTEQGNDRQLSELRKPILDLLLQNECDFCPLNPCMNNGQCTFKKTTQCQCKPGFTGHVCGIADGRHQNATTTSTTVNFDTTVTTIANTKTMTTIMSTTPTTTPVTTTTNPVTTTTIKTTTNTHTAHQKSKITTENPLRNKLTTVTASLYHRYTKLRALNEFHTKRDIVELESPGYSSSA